MNFPYMYIFIYIYMYIYIYIYIYMYIFIYIYIYMYIYIYNTLNNEIPYIMQFYISLISAIYTDNSLILIVNFNVKMHS